MAALTYRHTNLTRFRRCCATCAAVALLVLAGCGGDDEKAASSPAGTAPEATSSPATAETIEQHTDPNAPAPGETAPSGSAEDQTGGAGDELPAQSIARLTGNGGQITPAVVRVPAFISIRVELHSKDGGPYVLRFGNRTLAVREELPTVSRRFAGLRPGAALVGRSATGAGNPVRIEATAEPGP